MNKLIITTVATLLLTASGIALAQDLDGRPGKKGQRHQRGMPAMPAVEQLTRAIKHLDLNDEQKASIHTILQGMKAEFRPIMHQTQAGHVQLKELIKSDNYDEQAVATLAEKEGELAAERMKIAARAMSEVFSQLTAEQRTELTAMADKRQQRRGEKRQQPTN